MIIKIKGNYLFRQRSSGYYKEDHPQLLRTKYKRCYTYKEGKHSTYIGCSEVQNRHCHDEWYKLVSFFKYALYKKTETGAAIKLRLVCE